MNSGLTEGPTIAASTEFAILQERVEVGVGLKMERN